MKNFFELGTYKYVPVGLSPFANIFAHILASELFQRIFIFILQTTRKFKNKARMFVTNIAINNIYLKKKINSRTLNSRIINKISFQDFFYTLYFEIYFKHTQSVGSYSYNLFTTQNSF